MIYLSEWGGLAGRLIDPENQEEYKYRFFKPYASFGDMVQRAITPITAPVVISVTSLYLLCVSGYHLLAAIQDILANNALDAKVSIIDSGFCLLGSVHFLLSALLSPLVNFIDFIGSMFTRVAPITLPPSRSSDEYELDLYAAAASC